MNGTRALAILVSSAASGLILTAQQPPPQTPSQFRSGVDLVTLDVDAMGRDGSPIRDLRAEEIQIFVDGRPRTLRSFEFVEVAPVRASGKPAAPAPTPPPITPLATHDGRTIFVVVLHDHIRPGNERNTMKGVSRLVDQLEPRDRVAIVTMPFGRVEVELTTDRALIKRRLPQIVGHADTLQSVATGVTTTSESLALLDFLKGLVPLEGPKTILLISEGFQNGGPFEPDTGSGAAAVLDRPETRTYVPLLNNVASVHDDIADLRTAAAAARARFYVLQPHNFVPDPVVQPKADRIRIVANLDNDEYKLQSSQTSALAGLAAVVGGQFLRISGRSDGIFDRIVRETSGYYAVAFESEPDDRARRARGVDVATTRKGVTLRARRTFPDMNRPAPSTAAALLTDPRPFTALPLRTAAVVTRAADGQLKLMALADAAGRHLKEVGFALRNENGPVASWPGDPPAPGEIVVSARIVAPGRYRLRTAAIDEDGAAGTADIDLDAALPTAGALTTSSLMTGVLDASSFRPRLLFAPGDALVAYLELYGPAEGADITIELAPRNGGAPVWIGPAEVASTRTADRQVATAAVPLGSIPAGEYIVRAQVHHGSGTPGVVTTLVTLLR